MLDPSYTALALLPVVAFLLYHQLRQWRYKTFAHIPSPLTLNLFYGHLGYMSAAYKKFTTPQIHPDYILESVWKDHGSPEYLLLDFRPARYPLLLITSHELAEQISRSSKQQQYSTTKSPTIQEDVGPLIGKYSLLSEEGQSWKSLRRLFNPAFAPQHLRTLLPVIFDKTEIFVQKLDDFAESQEVAEMEALCTNLTFHIIGQVITDTDNNAQDDTAQDDTTQGDETFKSFCSLMATYTHGGLISMGFGLPHRIKRAIQSRRLDAAIKKGVQEKFEKIKAARDAKMETTKDRSVLALALQDIDVLTPHHLQVTADQVKTFMLAGHDTTSILLQRLFYALSIHPSCLAKIRAEHDAVFGTSDPREVFTAEPDKTIQALAYTSACIKEALRLWPPAGSARMSHNGLKLRTAEGDDICVDKCILYLIPHIIQRDPTVYGPTADDFVPERWIGDVDTSAAHDDDDATSTGPGKIPNGAWRPFERGPRNCIGQELANLETRIVLACVIRRYDFVKVGVGEVELNEKGQPVVDDKGRCKTKSEVVSRYAITPKPIDKMMMKVKFRVR